MKVTLAIMAALTLPLLAYGVGLVSWWIAVYSWLGSSVLAILFSLWPVHKSVAEEHEFVEE